jgi:hypothetical protein
LDLREPVSVSFQRAVARAAERLTQGYAEHGSPSDLADVMAGVSTPEVFDSWDTKLRVERVPWDPQKRYYMLRSAGPDKRFGTVDHSVPISNSGPGRQSILHCRTRAMST